MFPPKQASVLPRYSKGDKLICIGIASIGMSAIVPTEFTLVELTVQSHAQMPSVPGSDHALHGYFLESPDGTTWFNQHSVGDHVFFRGATGEGHIGYSRLTLVTRILDELQEDLNNPLTLRTTKMNTKYLMDTIEMGINKAFPTVHLAKTDNGEHIIIRNI